MVRSNSDFFAGQVCKKLEKALKQITENTLDGEIHRLRIRAKRARYAAELQKSLSRLSRRIDKVGERTWSKY